MVLLILESLTKGQNLMLPLFFQVIRVYIRLQSHRSVPGVGKCLFLILFGDFGHHLLKYVLDIIYPRVGWCLIWTFTNPCIYTLSHRKWTCKKSSHLKVKTCSQGYQLRSPILSSIESILIIIIHHNSEKHKTKQYTTL